MLTLSNIQIGTLALRIVEFQMDGDLPALEGLPWWLGEGRQQLGFGGGDLDGIGRAGEQSSVNLQSQRIVGDRCRAACATDSRIRMALSAGMGQCRVDQARSAPTSESMVSFESCRIPSSSSLPTN